MSGDHNAGQYKTLRSSELKPIEEITKPYRETIEAQAKKLREMQHRIAELEAQTERYLDDVSKFDNEANKLTLERDEALRQVAVLRETFKVIVKLGFGTDCEMYAKQALSASPSPGVLCEEEPAAYGFEDGELVATQDTVHMSHKTGQRVTSLHRKKEMK